MTKSNEKDFLSLSLESRRSLIDQEVGKKMSEVGLSFLYNFSSRLPGGEYRDISERTGVMDIKFFDWIKPGAYEKGKSKFYLNQTPREFFGIIDKVIQEQNVSFEKIENYRQELSSLEEDNFSPTREQAKPMMDVIYKLYELVLPVYKELRVMGYSHIDLIT